GGLHGAFAVLAALLHRARTGEGQDIDLLQWETSGAGFGEGLMDQGVDGSLPPPTGNPDPHMAPPGRLPPRRGDRWVSVVAADDEEWRRLCAGMGRPELAADPRFATLADRKQNEDALEELLNSWTAQLAAEEVTARLQAAGVAAFPALTNRDLAE